MAEEKYTCNKCGMTFEKKPDKHQCPLCGSLDVKQASEQTGSFRVWSKNPFLLKVIAGMAGPFSNVT